MSADYFKKLLIWGMMAVALPLGAQLYKADQILAKHMKAMGGEALISRLRSIKLDASVESGGLKGAASIIVLAPDRIRNEIKLGVQNEVACFNGKEQWKIDANGVLSIGGEEARKTALTQALILSYGYMMPDSTVRVRYLSREGEAGRSFILMEVLPDRGYPVKIWIDEQTWLLAKSETTADGFTTTSEYENFEASSGVMVPRNIHTVVEELQQTYDYSFYTVEVNGYVDERLFVITEPVEQNYAFSKGEKSAQFPFDFADGCIYLQGRINGDGPFNFILDSGERVSAIDASLARRLMLAPAGEFKAENPSEYAGMPMVMVDSFSLPGVSLYGQVDVSMQSSDLYLRYPGRPVDMVLGYDFLSRFATEVRFSDNTITVYERDKFSAPAGYSYVTCSYDSRIPLVSGYVEGFPGRFVLETASSSSLDLSEPFIKKNNLAKGRSKLVASELHPATGNVKMLAGRLKMFAMGPFVLENLPAGFAQNARSGLLASSQFDGLVGNDILKRFDFILDYNGDRLALRQNQALESEYRIGKSGIVLGVLDDGRFVVSEVASGSPAEDARIKPGEELYQVDGALAKNMGLAAIRQAFSAEDGKEITLKLMHGAESRDVTLTLRTYY